MNGFEKYFGDSRLFSRGEKRRLDPHPDVFQFDYISQPVRQRILYHFSDCFGNSLGNLTRPVVERLRREYGTPVLPHTRIENIYGNPEPDLDRSTEYCRFFLFKADTQQVLDVVQLSGLYVENQGLSYGNMANVPQFLDELNVLLIEEKIGYQYQSGNIVRLDNTFLHTEVVVSAIELLRDSRFAAASKEFSKAHEFYLRRENKSAIVEACKSLESVLKVICADNRWEAGQTPTMSKLLSVVHENGLFPSHMESGFTGLRSVLDSMVPTVRNREAGHGDGQFAREIPPHVVAFVLHVTAASIVYFVTSELSLKLN